MVDSSIELKSNIDFYNDLYLKYQSLNSRNSTINIKESKSSLGIGSKLTANLLTKAANCSTSHGNFEELIKLDFRRTLFDIKQRQKKNAIENSSTDHSTKSKFASSSILRCLDENNKFCRLNDSEFKFLEESALNDTRKNMKVAPLSKGKKETSKKVRFSNNSLQNQIKGSSDLTTSSFDPLIKEKLNQKTEGIKAAEVIDKINSNLGDISHKSAHINYSDANLPTILEKKQSKEIEIENEHEHEQSNNLKLKADSLPDKELSRKGSMKSKQSSHNNSVKDSESNPLFPKICRVKSKYSEQSLKSIKSFNSCDGKIKMNLNVSFSSELKKFEEPIRIIESRRSPRNEPLKHKNLHTPTKPVIRPVSLPKKSFNIFGCLPLCL